MHIIQHSFSFYNIIPLHSIQIVTLLLCSQIYRRAVTVRQSGMHTCEKPLRRVLRRTGRWVFDASVAAAAMHSCDTSPDSGPHTLQTCATALMDGTFRVVPLSQTWHILQMRHRSDRERVVQRSVDLVAGQFSAGSVSNPFGSWMVYLRTTQIQSESKVKCHYAKSCEDAHHFL